MGVGLQMVDKLDQGEIISTEITQYNYKALWKKVGQALYHAHVESRLKVRPVSLPPQPCTINSYLKVQAIRKSMSYIFMLSNYICE